MWPRSKPHVHPPLRPPNQSRRRVWLHAHSKTCTRLYKHNLTALQWHKEGSLLLCCDCSMDTQEFLLCVCSKHRQMDAQRLRGRQHAWMIIHSVPCLCLRMGGEGMKEYICIIPLSLGARMYASCVCVCVCVCVEERGRWREKEALFSVVSAFDQCPCACVCVCVWANPWCLGGRMKHCASIRDSQNTHYPSLLFLYSPSLSPSPPLTTIPYHSHFKGYSCRAALSSCIAAL